MQTYVVVRRGSWRSAEELGAAVERSAAEADRRADDVAWIRSYVLGERDGTLGAICIYEATGPEAIRRHAAAAQLPVDEIVKVADVVIVHQDPASATAPGRGGDS